MLLQTSGDADEGQADHLARGLIKAKDDPIGLRFGLFSDHSQQPLDKIMVEPKPSLM
ncbi:MAG: hypothetical protein HUU16_18540 [Candidatus Omnitrophica bacterium]|nr:hypothetical protein [bacterium]NUN98166.1 hypothetical protein [Candidatus Omnitrophota bacterium]